MPGVLNVTNPKAGWATRKQMYGASGRKDGGRIDGKKKCRTCGEIKPIMEFWRSGRGYQTECKPCMRRRNTAWHRANEAKVRLRNKVATNKSRRKNFEKFFLRSVKARAKKSGLEFSLTAADVVIPEYCPILGIKLARNTGWNRGHGLVVRDRSPSVDRIDNTKGYTPDNIIIVSYRANRIKSDATAQELRRLADFYENIDRRRSELAWSGRMRPTDIYGDKNVPVPRVQPSSTEEISQMSFGEI